MLLGLGRLAYRPFGFSFGSVELIASFALMYFGVFVFSMHFLQLSLIFALAPHLLNLSHQRTIH